MNYVTREKGEGGGRRGVNPRKFRARHGPRAGKMERDAGPKHTESGQKKQRNADKSKKSGA